MSRKIIPLQSVSAPGSTNTYIPAGARIHSVKGEADGKPTYDFILTHQQWDGAAVASLAVKYAGARNGRSVNLWNEWPQMVTLGSIPAAADDTATFVTPGSGVVLQVYFALGGVSV